MVVFWIRIWIQGSSVSGFVIRIKRLKKHQKSDVVINFTRVAGDEHFSLFGSG